MVSIIKKWWFWLIVILVILVLVLPLIPCGCANIQNGRVISGKVYTSVISYLTHMSCPSC